MSHTGGIVMGTDSSPSAYAEVAALQDLDTCSPPGTFFHYSNSGYKVLGLVLEAVAGKANSAVLMERVIGPLGMRHTEAEITNGNRAWQPTGYSFLHDDRPQPSCPPLVPATWFESNTADGSIISTPADMAAYLRMLLNRGACGKRRILTTRSFEMLTEPAAKPQDSLPNEYYGLGLGTRKEGGHRIIGHTGGMVGFVSEITADLDAGMGVVVLNNSRVDSSGLARTALRMATAILNGRKPPRIGRYDPTVVRGASRYAGTYHCGQKTVKVAADGRRLVLTAGPEAVTLEVKGRDRFCARLPRFELFEIVFARKGRNVVGLSNGPDKYYAGSTRRRPLVESPQYSAFVGQYRAHNPWTPSFRVVLRDGSLVFVGSTGEEEPLVPKDDGAFRVGRDPRSPETLSFDRVVGGKATRAVLSGGEWNRV
jgi:hypothetical protein